MKGTFLRRTKKEKAVMFIGYSRGLSLFVVCLLLFIVLCPLSATGQAGRIDWWPTVFDPVVNEQDGQVTDNLEWSQANWVAWVNGNDHGTFYAEFKINWQAVASNPANNTIYPGITLFDLNDFSTATTQEAADYNVFSYTFPDGNSITGWILANENETDDTGWLPKSGGLQLSHLIPEGAGNDLIDDRGFIVRLNDDPETDVHWFPGGDEPGDPQFDWEDWYCFFGTSGFNNSAFLEGLPNAIDGDNEVYEVAVHYLWAPVIICSTEVLRKVHDLNNGQPIYELIKVVNGPGHVGENGGKLINKLDYDIQIYNEYDPASGGHGGYHASAQADTYLIAEFTFDKAGQCTTEGWYGKDLNYYYGDFSGLFPGVSVLQEDDCTQNPSCLWGFFKNSWYSYECGIPPHPEQLVVPYENDLGQYIANEIFSPLIDLNPGGVIPATASSLILEVSMYVDNPLDAVAFPSYNFRSVSASDTSRWRDRNVLYYGDTKGWVRYRERIGDMVEPGATHVQLGLGVWDMCDVWCGIYGTGNCHSHAPLFDNITVYRVNLEGPQWSLRDIDLFQDNFPEDGTTTGKVRIDAAQDILPVSVPSIRPGDSLVVSVSELNVGLGTDFTGQAAVYIHVKCTDPAKTGSMLVDDPSRFPYIGSTGGWTKIRMDTVYTHGAVQYPVAGKYCADLNDDLFTPPDRIDYYFSAMDALGKTSYWSRGAGWTANEADAQIHPMEMQCLPTGNSDILYVDNFHNRGGEPYFDYAFDLMGITPDRYDVNGPSSIAGNGLASRAAASQIVDVYHKIIWNSGDLPNGTIGDGSGHPDKSPDAQLLNTFLDYSSVWNPGLYISGDNIAKEMQELSSAPFLALMTYISYNLTAVDHISVGEPISPLVIGLMPNTIFQHPIPLAHPDTIFAFGACPHINHFDVLEPTGAAVSQMTYSGSTDPARSAVISQETTNLQGKTARVVLSGFSYHNIRDDKVQFPDDRTDHLLHIIHWFENTVDDPTGAGNVPIANALYQNYPNPFNPVTTIKFSVKEKGYVNINVYNVAGQLVRSLVNEVRGPGLYADVKWDARDNEGHSVASGIYFYRLVTKGFSQTRKMVLLK